MAGFRIRIVRSAQEEFNSLPHPFRRHINRKIHFLKEQPHPEASVPLGYGRYRFRAYGYSILYTVHDEPALVVIGIERPVE